MKKRVVSGSKESVGESGLFRASVIVVIAGMALFAATSVWPTQRFMNSQGVLGDEVQKEEERKEEEQQKEEERHEEEEPKEEEEKMEDQRDETEEENENSRTSIKSRTEIVSTERLRMKVESEGDKRESEIETADGQKIKTKVEDDGTTKIEIENGTIKLKYKIVDGQVVLNVENEDGEEVIIDDVELEKLENEVENELEDDNIKVVPTTGSQLALTKNQVAALTDLPLTIDVETKELIITTPAGQKIVTVLPDEAVQNLIATNIISSVVVTPSDISNEEQLGTLTGVVKIETRDNEVVYKVNGEKTHYVFGVVPVTMPVTAFVSADTGLTVDKQQSILTNLVDFLSP